MSRQILCFMQNQWEADSNRWNAYWEEKRATPDYHKLRLYIIGGYTRSGYSATAKRLQKAFGDLAEEMEWENSTPKVGGFSASKFPPDLDHMRAVIEHVSPVLVVTFGSVARDGLKKVWPEERSLYFKHPVARGMVPGELKTWRPAVEMKLAELADVKEKTV